MHKDLDLATVKEAALFASLPDDLVETLFQRATIKTYESGEMLFVQGDAAQSVYVVLDGWVKLSRVTTTGAEVVVGVFTRGRSFGEAVVLQEDAYPVSAAAVTKCKLLQVRASVLLGMMRDRPELCLAMLSSTFRHLHSLLTQVEQLKAHTGAQRVAEFLLEFCVDKSGSCAVTLPYDKTLIAGRLGMQPQSLSRSFQRLRGIGVCILHDKASIEDVALLRDYVLKDRSAPWTDGEQKRR